MMKDKSKRRVPPADVRDIDLRRAEYHQAINFFFAQLKPDTTPAEIDAAVAEIAKRCGV